MNKLKKQLLYLGIGEFAALCTFVLLYMSLNHRLNLGMASFTAFFYLFFILLQGSIYWFYRYFLIIKKKYPRMTGKNILRFFRWFNILILMVISMLIPFIKSGKSDLIIAILVFIFGIIEYINYYWYRLSYGKSGFNINILLSKKLQKSSISKLINK